jgi:outer membrane protein W
LRHVFAVFALAFAAVPLLAQAAGSSSMFSFDPHVEVAASLVGGPAVGFGALTPTAWHMHPQRGADARVSFFLNDWFGVSLDAARQRLSTQAGGAREEAHSYPTSLLFDWYAPLHAQVVPYLGVGVSHLAYRRTAITPDGHMGQPDHAALMTEAGVQYLFSKGWMLQVGAKYGPARSTAEVNHADGTVDRIDFHQMYVSGGVGYRF